MFLKIVPRCLISSQDPEGCQFIRSRVKMVQMNKVGFIYDDIFLLHETPSGHPESKERLIAIIDCLKKRGLWEKLVHLEPKKAAESDILSVHR